MLLHWKISHEIDVLLENSFGKLALFLQFNYGFATLTFSCVLLILAFSYRFATFSLKPPFNKML